MWKLRLFPFHSGFIFGEINFSSSLLFLDEICMTKNRRLAFRLEIVFVNKNFDNKKYQKM